MTSITRTITLIRTGQLREHFMNWLRIKRRHLTYRLVRAIMSDPEVQKAFADSITCSTPIGIALNEHIDSQVKDVSVDDISGLERFVDDQIEDAIDRHHPKVDVEDIEDFGKSVEEIVDEKLNDPDAVDAVIKELGHRLASM